MGPSICLVAAAGLVVCLETLSECKAYSGVGRELNMNMNMVGCWNDTDRGKTRTAGRIPCPDVTLSPQI